MDMQRRLALCLMGAVLTLFWGTLTGCSNTQGGLGASSSNAGSAVAKSAETRKVFTLADDDKERKDGRDVGYFAAGCFWGVEHAFKETKGVLDTTVGYMGGTTENPTYEDVCGHGTKHAEAVRVVFDPKVINYDALVLEFLKIHDPTTLNRQGPDVGDQYRSAIFYANPEEEKHAKETIATYQKSGELSGQIVTTLEKFDKFYSAEDYHQDYFAKHPAAAACHIPRRK